MAASKKFWLPHTLTHTQAASHTFTLIPSPSHNTNGRPGVLLGAEKYAIKFIFTQCQHRHATHTHIERVRKRDTLCPSCCVAYVVQHFRFRFAQAECRTQKKRVRKHKRKRREEEKNGKRSEKDDKVCTLTRK